MISASRVLQRLFNLLSSKDSVMNKDMDYKELLQGKTLQVYWYLLSKGELGIRELQKFLAVSSPGTISYQIKKLVDAGLVSKNENTDKYFIKEEIRSGILGFYIRFGYKLIPRFSIYIIVFFAGIGWFLVNCFSQGDVYMLDQNNLVFLLFLLFGIGVFSFESYKIWKMKPE
ncbi:MAG: winged helix-turn-helix domain-containing protein [Candidatus Hodarchaeales archaeon]|jgi:hypothetical protein